jgi:acyl CoA:acetate/3-ketoacid CoA transferase alpha subunit
VSERNPRRLAISISGTHSCTEPRAIVKKFLRSGLVDLKILEHEGHDEAGEEQENSYQETAAASSLRKSFLSPARLFYFSTALFCLRQNRGDKTPVELFRRSSAGIEAFALRYCRQ